MLALEAWITVDGCKNKIKDAFLAWWPQGGKDFVTQRFGKPMSQESEGDDFFDDDCVEDECLDGPEIEPDAYANIDSDVVDMPTPEEKLQVLEDRHAVVLELEKVLPKPDTKVCPPETVDKARNELEAEFVSEKACLVSHGGGFSIFRKVRQAPCFDPEHPASKGATGCLARLELMSEPMKQFVQSVRVAEGILSGAPVVEGIFRIIWIVGLIWFDMV